MASNHNDSGAAGLKRGRQDDLFMDANKRRKQDGIEEGASDLIDDSVSNQALKYQGSGHI